jgi:hypothetical protein
MDPPENHERFYRECWERQDTIALHALQLDGTVSQQVAARPSTVTTCLDDFLEGLFWTVAKLVEKDAMSYPPKKKTNSTLLGNPEAWLVALRLYTY